MKRAGITSGQRLLQGQPMTGPHSFLRAFVGFTASTALLSGAMMFLAAL